MSNPEVQYLVHPRCLLARQLTHQVGRAQQSGQDSSNCGPGQSNTGTVGPTEVQRGPALQCRMGPKLSAYPRMDCELYDDLNDEEGFMLKMLFWLVHPGKEGVGQGKKGLVRERGVGQGKKGLARERKGWLVIGGTKDNLW